MGGLLPPSSHPTSKRTPKKPNQIMVNSKINEVKGKIPNITPLATTSSPTDVENKVAGVSNLVKKNDYNLKINEIEKKITDHNHVKCFTTPEFNKLTSGHFAPRSKQENLATKVILIVS